MIKTIFIACATLAVSAAMAQKVSLAPDAFLKDVNSLAGVSRIGSVLLAADPNKKKWADYCSASQGLARRGEFREAIRTAAKALYIGESSNGNYGAPIIWASNDIATAYSYSGDRANATIWADKTLAAINKGYESGVRQEVMVIGANAHLIRALGMSHDGRHAEAISEMEKSIENLPGGASAGVKAELAVAFVTLFTRAGMLDKAGEALAKVMPQNDPYLKVIVNRAAGDLALAKKDAPSAMKHYEESLTAARSKDFSFHVVMSHLGLARAARANGNTSKASTELTQALADLETLRSSFASSELRTALFGNLQSVFDEAVDFFAAGGDWSKALAASESSRARAMLDLQRKVVFAEGASPPAVTPLGVPQIQARLEVGQTMVVYHQLPNRLVAWVVTKDSLRGQMLAPSSDSVSKSVNLLRSAIEREDKNLVVQAQSLYKLLIDPLNLSGNDDIVFVPHKSLHLLPFQALHNGRKWLIETNAVTTAMSASLYEISDKGKGSIKLAALGNPDLGKQEWSLPGSEAEVRAIQTLYSDANVFVQKDASKAQLSKIAPGAQVVHIAAHGVVDEVDPMYSMIKLAVSGPLNGPVTALQVSDMEAREFAALNLQSARLVSLSACNSGVGKVANGDEFMGFKRALFIAGAKSALVSLWPVDDESTRILMTEFHKGWQTTSKARAIQSAQIKVLSDPKYASPFYWAAFTLIGDPG